MLDDYTVALDATLASRAEALDVALVRRAGTRCGVRGTAWPLFDDTHGPLDRRHRHGRERQSAR